MLLSAPVRAEVGQELLVVFIDDQRRDLRTQSMVSIRSGSQGEKKFFDPWSYVAHGVARREVIGMRADGKVMAQALR